MRARMVLPPSLKVGREVRAPRVPCAIDLRAPTPGDPQRAYVCPRTNERGSNMATYIMLLKYTEQGIRNIKESPSRLEKAKQLLKSFGGELKSFYLVQGRF